MEEVAAQFGETPGFFQLYTPTDREVAAEPRHPGRGGRLPRHRGHPGHLDHSAGVRVTWPRPTSRSCAGHCLANYFSDPVFRSRAGEAA